MDSETIKTLEEMLDQRMGKLIVLDDFLKEYKEILEDDMIPHTESDIKIAMNLIQDEPRFETARDKCSLTQLIQPDDASIVEYIPGQPEGQRIQPLETPKAAEKLATFKALMENRTGNARNPFRRTSEIYKLAPFPIINDDQTKNSSSPSTSSTATECAYYNDLLIHIRIYRPSRATHIGRSLEKPVFAEQFQCLGSNLLTELRDKISCVCNKYHFYDISDDPERPLPEKHIDPSFFFITDTFYNDKRDSRNPDYSAVLIKWAKKAIGMEKIKFKVAQMEKTRFIDLTISLGFPQLYQHHGNCEHLFTFSQVELLTPTLTFNRTMTKNCYPLLHSFGLYNNRVCNMCGNVQYVFIVEMSDRQLHDPAYLCSKCFYSFHYIDGKKIGKFRAYRIQDYSEQVPVVSNEAIDILNEDNTETLSTSESNETSKKTKKNEMKSKEAPKTATTPEASEESFRVVFAEDNSKIVLIKEERNKV